MPRVLSPTKDSLTKIKLWKCFAITIFIVLIYFVFSIGLTFYQRNFLQVFRFPLSTVLVHLVTKYILAATYRKVLQYYTDEKPKCLSFYNNLTKIAPTGLAGGFDVAFSNWGLSLITVSLYTMTKSTSIIFLLLFALLFHLEKPSWSVFFIVLTIASGLFMFTYKSTQFNELGFVLVLAASLTSGLRWTLTQFIMQEPELYLTNPLDIMYYVQSWMIMLVLPFAMFFEGSPLSYLCHNEDFFQLVYITCRLLIGAFIAFFLEIMEYLVIQRTSSLTLSVAGIGKEVLTLGLAVEVNGDYFTLLNCVGLALCLAGIIAHVIHKAKNTQSNRPLARLHHRRKLNGEGGESAMRFLPLNVSDNENDESVGSDDDSGSEVLFSVLQNRDRYVRI